MQFVQSETLASKHPGLKKIVEAIDQRLSNLSKDAIIDPSTWQKILEEDAQRINSVFEGLTNEGLLEKIWGSQCDCGTFILGTANRKSCVSCGFTGTACAMFAFSPAHVAETKKASTTTIEKTDILKYQANEDEIRVLAETLRAGRVTPFVGAGLTIPCGYPGWSSFLLSEAVLVGIEAQIRSDIASSEFEEAAERLNVIRGNFNFDRRIEHAYARARTLTGPIVHLPRLVTHSVITTNFDDAIERVFLSKQRYLTPVIGSRFSALSHAMFGTGSFLIKLHGDARDNASRVLTKSEYDQQYGKGPPWQEVLPTGLIRIFSSTSLLFIGCSLAMDRTMAVLRQAIAVSAAPTHFAIVEAPSDETTFSERRRTLGDMRIAPIWYPHGEHAWVNLLIEEIATQAGR